MTDLKLFCVENGKPLSNPFSVKITVTDTATVDDLKELIKAKKANVFYDIDADELTLWSVSILNTNNDEDVPIFIDNFKDKNRLLPRTQLSALIADGWPDEKTYIIVQRPLPDALQPEVAALRKQLSKAEQLQSERLDSFIDLGIIVKPEKNATLSLTTFVDEATLDHFKSTIFEEYPQYAHDNHLEIFVYGDHPKRESIRNDEDLRKALRIVKKTHMTELTIALETPTKSFSAWTFRDVCSEYQLSLSTDPGLFVIPPFTGIEAAPLNSYLEKKMLVQLTDDVESMVHALNLIGANEATKSMIVGSFLVKATRLFEEDLFLAAKRNLSGPRGNGPVDFSVHLRDGFDYRLCVTEVKKDGFVQGVAQNIVQLEMALTSKKRKRGRSDLDGEEELPMEMRSYGIVTDAGLWLLIECTMHEDETVSYRMTDLERTLNYGGDWKDDAKFIFERLVWLWSRMRDEIHVPARDCCSRKLSSSPIIRQTFY